MVGSPTATAVLACEVSAFACLALATSVFDAPVPVPANDVVIAVLMPTLRTLKEKDTTMGLCMSELEFPSCLQAHTSDTLLYLVTYQSATLC